MQNSTNFTKDILGLEKKYWTAMRDKDLDTALELTDFPCLVVGPQGAHSFEREEFIKMFNSSNGSIKSFNFDEKNAEVRQISNDTAIIAYSLHSTFLKDGKDATIDAVDASTWVKRDNKWLCAMHTEAELKKQ